MPLYEFACKNCGNVIELLMSMSSAHPTSCERCQSGPLVKLVSRSNFALKGQGWYETDFKRKPASPASCDSSGGGSPACHGGACKDK